MDFVAADTDEIDATISQWFRLLREPLGSVDMEQAIALHQSIRDCVDRLDDPCFVVDLHDADQKRIVSYCMEQFVRIDLTAALWTNQRDFETLFAKSLERFEDRFMLDHRTYQMHLSRFFTMRCGTQDREIIALRCAASEYDFVAAGPDYLCELFPSQADQLFGLFAKFMGAARVAVYCVKDPNDFFTNSRFDRVGCVAVEVDRHEALVLMAVFGKQHG